jgi:hypothetical protein
MYQPDSFAASYTVHREGVFMWRGPNRATAITAMFVASALYGGTSVVKVTQDYYDVA